MDKKQVEDFLTSTNAIAEACWAFYSHGLTMGFNPDQSIFLTGKYLDDIFKLMASHNHVKGEQNND